MKRFYILILLLSIATVGISQNYITPTENYHAEELVLPDNSSFAAFDLHNNLLFGTTGDTIYCVDIQSNETLSKFNKPEGYKSFTSFLTLSPDAQKIYVGYTVSGNTDDRIYEINTQTKVWKKIASISGNYDLEFLNDKMLVSATNNTKPGTPNSIFVLDTTATQNHKKLIETVGYSAGLAIDASGNVFYGTNASSENALYKFSSEKVNEFLALQDTFLRLKDGKKLFDLENGAGDVAADLHGNVFVNQNKWGEGGKILQWSKGVTDGRNYSVVATSKEFLTNLVINKSNTATSYPVQLYQLAFGKPITKIYQPADYSNGVFVINEDWFGHSNGSVNFYSNNGDFTYRTLQLENDSSVLGVTTQYGTVYGDNLYLMSKQGNRLVVADAKTMTVKNIIKEFVENEQGNKSDGRAFVGVTPEKGYVSTSNGIYVFNIASMEIAGKIKNADGEIGNMIRAGSNVFAVNLKKIYVIDSKTNKIKMVISGGTYGGIAQTVDGNVWIGGGVELIKINPYTLQKESIAIPESAKTSTSAWAWNANSFCASATENALFWAKPGKGWAGSTAIVKYDLSEETAVLTEEFIKIEDNMELYGAGIRVHPKNNQVYVTAKNPGWGANFSINNLNIYDGNNGNLVSKNPMMQYYWFPAVVAFPDNYAPTVDIDTIFVERGKYQSILLTDMLSDKDNNDASIYATVSEKGDESLINATIIKQHLFIQSVGDAKGTAAIKIKAYSNGKMVEKEVTVVVTFPTAAEDIAQNKLKIYPNPFNKQITIEGITNDGDNRFYLYSIDGKMMKNGTLNASNDIINTADLPKGVYLIKVLSNNKSFTQKLIK